VHFVAEYFQVKMAPTLGTSARKIFYILHYLRPSPSALGDCFTKTA